MQDQFWDKKQKLLLVCNSHVSPLLSVSICLFFDDTCYSISETYRNIEF